jgi:hypothetical protein
MFDFYVFFVESVYEVIFFVIIYVGVVEKFLVGWYGVERVRGMMIRYYSIVEARFSSMGKNGLLLEVLA